MTYQEAYEKLDATRPESGFDVSFRLDDARELSFGLDLLPKKPIGLEIGSHNGASAYFMCSYRPDLILYSLDIEPREKWIKNLKGLKAVPLKGRSDVYPWEKPLDILFIDGDHSYEWVVRDLYRFMPFVKKGGIISGHDYDISTVKLAVDEVLYPTHRKIAAEHSFVYQKC